MLTSKQKKEILEHLEKAQNPVFFFDNDSDGLCSFLLLQRWLGRGKGVVVKSYPELDPFYFRKVDELNADYLFILDKPLVSEEFFKRVEERNIPVVWIDHHEIKGEEIPKFVNYYNPLLNKSKTNEPVTAICYDLTRRKEDLWMAVVGCVADCFLPDFYKDFEKQYPELAIKTNRAFDVLYKSDLGKIAKILSNGLKDKTSNVVSMLKFLMKVKSPYDVLEENPKIYSLHKRSQQIEKKYLSLLDKAKKIAQNSKKILFFRYSGDLSVSGELSNELSYLFPEKIIAVAYIKGTKVNLSLRGKNIKSILLKVIEGIEGARGGGHNDAVGGVLHVDNLEEFRRRLEEELIQ